MRTDRRTIVIAASLVAVIVLIIGVTWVVQNNGNYPMTVPETAREPDYSEDIRQGKIAALINGEPVYFTQLDRGLPEGTAGPRLKKGRSMRFSMVLNNILLRQFLDEEGITVSEDEVKKEFERLKKHPSEIHTDCCSPSSINEYFELHFCTMDDFLLQISNSLRIKQYIDNEWKLSVSMRGGTEQVVEKGTERVKKEYAKAYQIFLSVKRLPMKNTDTERAFEILRERADGIVKELDSGASFSEIARDRSNDIRSVNSGGFIGYIQRGYLNKTFSDAVFSLDPGEMSAPVRTEFGYHIIRRDIMTSDDVMEVLRMEFDLEQMQKLMSSLHEKADIKVLIQKKDDEGIDYQPSDKEGDHLH